MPDYLSCQAHQTPMPTDEFPLEMHLPFIKSLYRDADPAHDFSHVLRVYRNAEIIGRAEGADMQILLLASLLHDVGSEKKNRSKSTCLHHPGREAAVDFLKEIGLNEDSRRQVLYAIDVHRFSLGIFPETLEARILQDADRLDAIGAIGIARVFMTGGAIGRELYHPTDPFCRAREPDDGKWNLDHFYKKLLRLEAGMHTESARKLAAKRTEAMKRFLSDLDDELADPACSLSV